MKILTETHIASLTILQLRCYLYESGLSLATINSGCGGSGRDGAQMGGEFGVPCFHIPLVINHYNIYNHH